MKPLKILVVEDEAIIAENLAMALEQLGYKVVGKAGTFTDALELIESEKPDFALIDIVLSGAKTGIDLANEINAKQRIPFIFLTSHGDEKTVDAAKKARPAGYLLKPYEKEDLYAAIEVAVNNYSERPQHSDTSKPRKSDCIFVKHGGLYVKVKFEEIQWLEASGKYVEIRTGKDKHLVRSSFKEFMTTLPSDSFFQTHKSYAVNLDELTAIGATYVLLGEMEIPLGRAFKEDLISRMELRT